MPTLLTDIQYNNTLKLFLRSKTPTAKLKLRGIAIEVHEHSPNVNYIILLKKSKTKLVLKADSPAEFDGWLRTIKTVSELKTGEGEQVNSEESVKSKHRYENVEVSETENGKELVKIKGKAPVPTPRSKTPSLEMTSLQTESIVTINIEENNLNLENSVHSPEICKKNENGSTKVEDKDHLSVENSNNHDNQSMTIVDIDEADNSEIEENLIKPCLPIPVSASSEDSTSSSSDADEEKPRFCTPIISMGHKFSDGIVWETIEECDEENISSSESEKVDTGMNHAEKEADVVNMKIDFHEGSSAGVMTAGSAPDKKARLQPHAPFITATQAEKDCDSLSPKVGKSSPPPEARMVDYSVRYQQDLHMKDNEVTKAISVNEDAYDGNECAFCPDKKEPPVSKEEIGNISVKNLAKFWEQVSQQKLEDSALKDAAIQKKWNSMPNLKERKQQKQHSIKAKKEPIVHHAEVVKSDDIIDDVDLCRSVSLSDRKQMFEMMTVSTIGEQSKQWKSMPSLKQDKSPSTSTSPRPPFKSRVRWEDQSDTDDYAIERGRSPVRELVKNFQTSQPLVCFKRGSSPMSPEFKSNEVRTHESLSSSDSISSSMTGSSVSTVIDTRTRPASHLDDSSGEIYTDSSVTDVNTGEEGPYVLENGAEYSLTSLGMSTECKLIFVNTKVIVQKLE